MIVSPSLLSANFMDLKNEINRVKAGGASWLHYDVMDGHFVPNISFGSGILTDIRKDTDLVLDVHLMISDPLSYIDSFIKAGANYITFHYEANPDATYIHKVIDQIKKANCKVGMTIKPKTDINVLLPYLDQLDMVLIMSVEPGFGGQSFIESSIDKIKSLRKIYQGHIEVDGGINEQTGALCKEAGADVLVSGSYIFKHPDINIAIKSLL